MTMPIAPLRPRWGTEQRNKAGTDAQWTGQRSLNLGAYCVKVGSTHSTTGISREIYLTYGVPDGFYSQGVYHFNDFDFSWMTNSSIYPDPTKFWQGYYDAAGGGTAPTTTNAKATYGVSAMSGANPSTYMTMGTGFGLECVLCYELMANIVQMLEWQTGAISWGTWDPPNGVGEVFGTTFHDMGDIPVNWSGAGGAQGSGGIWYDGYDMPVNSPSGVTAWCVDSTNHAHDVPDIQISGTWVHRAVVGFLAFQSIYNQWCNDAGVSVGTNHYSYDSIPWNINILVAQDATTFNNAVGQGGSHEISWTTYNYGVDQGQTQVTYYPTAATIVSDMLSMEQGAIPVEWLGWDCVQDSSPWGDIASFRSALATCRSDITSVYFPSEYIVTPIGNATAGGYNEIPVLGFIAAGVVAAKYRYGPIIHHVGGQDWFTQMYNHGSGYVMALACPLAFRISHWEDMAGITDGNRTLTPDISAWSSLDSFQSYTSTDGTNPWTRVTKGFCGTRYYPEVNYGSTAIWATWLDSGETWTLGGNFVIDQNADVELVLAPQNNQNDTYGNSFLWHSLTNWDSTEDASNDAGRLLVQISGGVLSLTDDGKEFVDAHGGRVGFKIPVEIDGGSGEDTVDPLVWGMFPENGAQNVDPNTIIEVWCRDIGSGIDTADCTVDLDGTTYTSPASSPNTFYYEIYAGGNYRFRLNHATFAEDSEHDLLWHIEDNAGNSTEEMVTFIVSTAEPEFPPMPQNFRVVGATWHEGDSVAHITLEWDQIDDDLHDGLWLWHRTTTGGWTLPSQYESTDYDEDDTIDQINGTARLEGDLGAGTYYHTHPDAPTGLNRYAIQSIKSV